MDDNKITSLYDYIYETEHEFYREVWHKLSQHNTELYRSRIPFIPDKTLADITALLDMAYIPMEYWTTISLQCKKAHIRTACMERDLSDPNRVVENLIDEMISPYSTRCSTQICNAATKTNFEAAKEYLETNKDLFEYYKEFGDDSNVDSNYKGIYMVAKEQPTNTLRTTDGGVDGVNLSSAVGANTLCILYGYSQLAIYEAMRQDIEYRFSFDSALECKEELKEYAELILGNCEFDVTNFKEHIIQHYKNSRDILRKKLIKDSIKKIENAVPDYTQNTENRIAQTKEEIQNKLREIEQYYRRIERLTLDMLYSKKNEQPLKQFCINLNKLLEKGFVKNITYEVVNDYNTVRGVTVSFRTAIKYWEEDEAQQWLNTLRGKNLEIFKALFIDKKATVWTECQVLFDFKNNHISNNGWYNGVNETVLPNPHVARYNCFGNNTAAYIEAVANRDYEAGLAIVLQSISQLNMLDHTVVSEFICRMLSDDTYNAAQAIEEQDGTLITVGEFKRKLAEGAYNEEN